MTLPEHLLSTTPVLGNFLPPDDRDPSPLVGYEYGGVALNDPSQGHRVRIWHAKLVVDGVSEIAEVRVGAEDVSDVVFFTSTGITEVDLAFDQNMNPFIAFVEHGIAKYYWYDTALAGYTVSSLPVGSRSPKCTLDDKRKTQTTTSDILLVYMRGTTMYYREQRDRFLIEYTLKTDIGGNDMLLVGMSDQNRVQFLMGLQDYPEATINYRVTTPSDLTRNRVTVAGDRRRLVKVSYG